MFRKRFTSMLLASSMLVALQAGPVFAGEREEAVGTDLAKYEAEFYGDKEGIASIEEMLEAEEAELIEGRRAADAAADEAEDAADQAQAHAEETEGEEIVEAAEAAAEDAANARAAADLADTARDMRTVDMTVEIAEAAREAAVELAAEAKEAAKEEAAAKEEEMLSQAEYLGNFTLTAYCNCASCCGTAGNATASGVMPTSGHTVAMGGIDFGTKLLINGTVYTVEDRGTPYGHVDIFMDSHGEALQFGMSSADVYLIKE